MPKLQRSEAVIKWNSSKKKWCVMSKDGSKNLGCYTTKKEAVKRLQQVEYFKRKAEIAEQKRKEYTKIS